MIRIKGVLEIILVTTPAGIGGIVVIPMMTRGAIIPNKRVCSIQRIIGVMVRHAGRCPIRRRGMTGRAIRRKAEISVIRIVGLIKSWHMAGGTFCRCALESSAVTGRAIHIHMGSGQRECCRIVIKDVIRIAGGVTCQTSLALIDVAANSLVFIVRFLRLVTGQAGEFTEIPLVLMAFRARGPGSFMRSRINGEIQSVVIPKFGRHPAGICRVTHATVGREACHRMTGLGSGIKVGLVTGGAIRRRLGKIPTCVALPAIRDVMPLGEREKIMFNRP